MNLRDRGYSSSMDGFTPKLQKAERHTREKSVAPGEATVQKGQKVQPTRSLPSYGAVPEYGPVAPASPSQAPLQFQHTDLNQGDYQRYNTRHPVTPAPSYDSLSMDEIKRRMNELEQALSSAYENQRTGRQTKRNMPSGEEGHYPEEIVSNYNWNNHDWLDDTMQDITDDPVALYLEQMEHAKAAATGRAINDEARRKNLAAQANRDAVTQNINDSEKSIDDLYFEYNNLKNEYNARLARYLQSIGG